MEWNDVFRFNHEESIRWGVQQSCQLRKLWIQCSQQGSSESFECVCKFSRELNHHHHDGHHDG